MSNILPVVNPACAVVNSSHGTYEIDAMTGFVFARYPEEDLSEMTDIYLFDLDEFFATYPKAKRGEVKEFDIMDLAYSYVSDSGVPGHEPPVEDWRMQHSPWAEHFKALVEVTFASQVLFGEVDAGSLRITHESGRGLMLDTHQQTVCTVDPRIVRLVCIPDPELFRAEAGYKYDLTKEDILSWKLSAALNVETDSNKAILDITYRMQTSEGESIGLPMKATVQ